MNDERYLELLAEKYPTEQAVSREIINLTAILSLPKGTEHFMSDLHGEYEAFCHILNNCSGVIREKVDLLFGETLSDFDREEICTLIYYPVEKLELVRKEGKNNEEWYRATLGELIDIARLLSSKYTRSKVRKAMPKEYAYILDELIHVQKDEDDNQVVYHRNILDTLLELDNADEFIEVLAGLIKRLAVDHLHIVGDIFDRGACADRIMDLLMQYHSLDIEWGNHDILWMGAAAGSKACIATVVRNNLKYNNTKILENSYGISLRNLALFAEKIYPNEEPMKAALKAISVMLFKLEGQVILRNPDYNMTDKLLLHKVNVEKQTVEIDGTEYAIKEEAFPTVNFDSGDMEDIYQLSEEEEQVMEGLRMAFVNSIRLRQHIDFLYQRGSMYRIFNGNLLYHGCVPLDESGNLEGVAFSKKRYHGREYLDYAERIARRAWSKDARQKDRDFMWYLWCGRKSPLSGRNIKTFERTYVLDENTWFEQSNPYYKFYHEEKICNMILHEFGLYSERSHIINGHTPVRTSKGEHPVRANGKLLVIDGGFCKSYHKTTGIAGYTLIFNSHGIRIKSHQPFQSVYAALTENKDIESKSELVETEKERLMVRDTDSGKKIKEDIDGLKMLLQAYRNGDFEI
ncbi:fructose-1,6-bisphosphatase [Dorea formicigenerans]|uniref:Fructose-1,6-bisphosphatase class 3 n=1 Tax=Dorea formicigenerans TaxID=39486 RepID=A0A3E4F830_9FIRM|nr:fructose-1,6-bisphosphatase [Dorea formicigenerans]RGI85317.1 fructose-1,6-bisphosphatase [Dorea formicigenerans]RGI88355.1 fructose-1,6-bisphosphatase [Dorea formicigenerans]RGK47345.1 fructose-1,6-bisphosphatase [Dorea formicigenerans]